MGDVRDAKGLYYGFPWHTIAAFEAAGLRIVALDRALAAKPKIEYRDKIVEKMIG